MGHLVIKPCLPYSVLLCLYHRTRNLGCVTIDIGDRNSEKLRALSISTTRVVRKIHPNPDIVRADERKVVGLLHNKLIVNLREELRVKVPV